MQHGLFVGLTTLDWIYQADHPPLANEKVVATETTMAAGGPATNAAVTFSVLGRPTHQQQDSHATLLSALGQHPLSHLIRDDLAQHEITVADLTPNLSASPPVSSVIITQSTGDRAVISRNATQRQISEEQASEILKNQDQMCHLHQADILLIDGHQMALSAALAAQAKQNQIPIVVDAGSWKPHFETVLTQADIVIASANFKPPGRSAPLDYLEALDIQHIAITQGANPILISQQGIRTQLSPPTVKVVDTLGAGDIFHGAFCYHYLINANLTDTGNHNRFIDSLQAASQVAAFSCQFFGTRAWISRDRQRYDK